MASRTMFIVFLLLLFMVQLNGQMTKLIGLVDHKLIQIDPNTANTTLFSETNIPQGADVRLLTFSPEQEIFYTIVNASTEPSLAKIDLKGQFEIIGKMTLDGKNILMCEGMSYSVERNKLYAFVSLNGNKLSSDYYSETLVELNMNNGNAKILSTMVSGSTLQTDADNICIINDMIYLHDGSPSTTSGFYSIDVLELGSDLSPKYIGRDIYFPMRDMAAINQTIYFTTNYNDLLNWNTIENEIGLVGITHKKNQYNEQPIVGLANITFQMASIKSKDTRR